MEKTPWNDNIAFSADESDLHSEKYTNGFYPSNNSSKSRGGTIISSKLSSTLEKQADGELHNGRFIKHHGIHWFLAGLFCVGDMAGGGIVALPKAMILAQFWPGIAISIVMALVATASAIYLGKAWDILLRRWPEYRTHCRKPYAEIGSRALGIYAKNLVSVSLNITQFGVCVVFLLLSAKNIHDFIDTFIDNANISFCYVIIVVALVLLPITMLKSPEDFWWAIVAGMASTGVAVILLSIGAVLDYGDCAPHRSMTGFVPENYFLSLGTVLFTFGGHSAFPTIQHDMKQPHHFTKSAILAFLTITLFYAPVVFTSYLSYGDSIGASVINSVQTIWIQQTVNIMITCHCLLTLTLIGNPLNQEVEEMIGIPQTFGWKRVATRSAVMVAVVFVAETIPNFGPLLDLMGGSTVTLTSLTFPPIFYLFLSTAEKMDDEMKGTGCTVDRTTSLREVFNRTDTWTLAVCAFVVAFGVIGGAAATYSAIKELSGESTFTAPCYVALFSKTAGSDSHTGAHTRCCGSFHNISRFNDQCM